MPKLRIETPADGVALVVLSRPGRLNALDDDLLGLEAEGREQEVRSRAVALHGSDRFDAWRPGARG